MMTDGRPAPDAAARFYWCSALFGSQRLRSHQANNPAPTRPIAAERTPGDRR
jgi:hypothetical protein